MSFKCDKCGESFQQKCHLTRHISSKHSNVNFQCTECTFTANRKDSLNRHLKLKHGIGKRKASCSPESNTPKKAKPINQSTDTQHGWGVEPDQLIEPEPIIDWGDEEFTAEDAQDAENQVIEPEPEKFRCSICDINLNCKNSLVRHIKEKHSMANPYTCSKCGKSFARKENLMSHKKLDCTKKKKKLVEKKKVKGRVNIEVNENGEVDDGHLESAMRGMFTKKTWLIRKGRDPRHVLRGYYERILRWLVRLLLKNPLKFYITMRITMVKHIKDGDPQFATAGFNGATRVLLRASEIPDLYQVITEKIIESFNIWCQNGSGWVFQSIDDLTLYHAEYVPHRGSSYIPTPESIAGKHAVVNPMNEDDNDCFKYATRLFLNYDWIDKKHASRPITDKMIAEKNLKDVNMEGCQTPMQVDDIDKFEKNNNMAINLYHIKHNGKSITPLRISKKNVPLLDDYCNLLLIEGEETCHYTYIRKFDRLLAFSKGKTHQFCPFCLHGFDARYQRTLKDHMPLCREYGGQKTMIPKKGDDIAQFKDQHKMLPVPAYMVGDFECKITKMSGCEPDDTTSSTDKTAVHEPSGFSLVLKFLPCFGIDDKYISYRGDDAGEVFLNTVMKEEKEIFKFLKENEKGLDMSDEDEKLFEKQEKCHICNDPFLDKTTPEVAKHLQTLKPLLEINRLDVMKIPSLRKVKKQKRVISIELHPDKVGVERADEIKEFFNKNQELQDYLVEHNLIEDDQEADDLFEGEDELDDEEVQRIMKKGRKVKDHDHWSGEFRGAAHNGCNIAYRKVRKIPVFFHNLTNYDGHIIFDNLSKTNCKDPKVIAKTMEKFIGFSIGKLDFKDSFQHLNASLDKLVSNLVDKTKIENCKHCPRRGTKKELEKHMKLRHRKEHEREHKHPPENKKLTLPEVLPTLHNYFTKEWGHLKDPTAFELLTRKGVYPYAYMDSNKRFEEETLPARECFYNDLSKKHITDEDYAFVHKLWSTFKLKNMGELHDLYMMTDTLLLADVFENYRDVILKNYRLDPAHFYTAPSLSWSAGLLHTKVKLEIPRDVDMHIFIDRGLRGGISMVANHFARANNPALKEFWDPVKQRSYIKFVDANNLYGWAMSQYLPTGGFKWMRSKELLKGQLKHGGGEDKLDISEYQDAILNLDEKGDTGYFFEVDLSYPQLYHQNHNDFPLAPESMKIEKDMLSAYQTEMGDEMGVKYGQEDKLCLTLKDKTRYITHFRNLQFYLRNGMVLKKIHKILQFKQSDWLRPYIELNTELRQKADNKFEENFAKLMNNSFFGKV